MQGNLEQKYCCGCGLCSFYVEGRINENGYYRPEAEGFPGNFDTKYCYCNQLDACAGNGMWGEKKAIYFGHAVDETIRKQASSGGALTTIACYLLENKLVDYVIQIAPSAEVPTETVVVFNRTSEDVKRCSGSRYTGSASLQGVLKQMECDKTYALIGKPCDIRVMRAYIHDHQDLKRNIKYLLSFFCGGTPSRQANDKLLQEMGLSKKELVSFSYRGNGWPGMTTGYEKNGNVAKMEYEESWGNILGRDLQDICRFCWEGTGEAADISCGDGWYLKNGAPSFEERPGRNILFANTETGAEVLKMLEADGKMELEEISDLTTMRYIQPGQYMRKGAMFARVLAMRIMGKSVPRYTLRKIFSYAKYLSLTLNIRMFGGTIKRIMRGRIK